MSFVLSETLLVFWALCVCWRWVPVIANPWLHVHSYLGQSETAAHSLTASWHNTLIQLCAWTGVAEKNKYIGPSHLPLSLADTSNKGDVFVLVFSFVFKSNPAPFNKITLLWCHLTQNRFSTVGHFQHWKQRHLNVGGFILSIQTCYFGGRWKNRRTEGGTNEF